MHEGKDQPIAYASRHLNKAEVKYSTIEKEAAAPLFARRIFVIVSNHNQLQLRKSLKTKPKGSDELKYHPGRVYDNADFLSQIPINSFKPPQKTEDIVFRKQ
ncbi:hypothetical protein OUZ56_018613 [Daphnia magna]|uniref:Reverse transcriptase RNase H-like domain-containing protein n=1 Tax=Daphnia magna TaxID=35525 RepID=A0ABQ9Z9E4_9CRUS|nr:hypothetical protein OUZ56_018613 [Daphnia magna]